ncbi:hypothetical protein GCM10023149_53870 [Mucilaginibacter gynuensis]|uniref:Ig-like domain-containing protein n=1 Tax=Mucilaginibacter gynuensis TaxID=1302236 RepID=A0ABP8HN40_9SPHI
MRVLITKLLLFALFAFCTIDASAQSDCTGSFGDPVVTEDFGYGPQPGGALPDGEVLEISYTSNSCPEDRFNRHGEYSIVNSVDPTCHPGAWHNVTQDHTIPSRPDGRMMIINASYDESTFFVKKIGPLCPNTTYQFQAYVLNLITTAAGNNQPDLLFSIETTDGALLTDGLSTGSIMPTPTPQWLPFSKTFTTGANEVTVILRITNKAPGGAGNDFLLDDITFRACGPNIVTGFDGSDQNITRSVCNTQVPLTVGGVSAGYTERQWQRLENNTWVDIPNANTAIYQTPANLSAGVYQYRVALARTGNIGSPNCRVYSGVNTLTVRPLPVAVVATPAAVCEGSALTLTASGGEQYRWTGPGIANPIFSTDASLTFTDIALDKAGTYYAEAMTAGCIGPKVPVTVQVDPKIRVSAIAANVEICLGESTQLTATGGANYHWSASTRGGGISDANIANPTVTPTETTTYTVVADKGACSSIATVTVRVLNKPVVSLTSYQAIYEGQSVKLDGAVVSGDVTGFSWSTPMDLDDPYSLTPTASPRENIKYTLTLSGPCGTDTASVLVRVFHRVDIPNTFSPNGDGVNDFWSIDALATLPQSVTTVFNRYGQQVYRSVGYSKPWNGTYNGTPLPAGSYYYMIDLNNKMPKRTGWVLIVR